MLDKPLVKFNSGETVIYDNCKYVIHHVLVSRRGVFLRLYSFTDLINIEDPKLRY